MWTEQQADREAEQLASLYCDDPPYPLLRLRAADRDDMAKAGTVITLVGCEMATGRFGLSIRLYTDEGYALTFTGSDWRCRDALYMRKLARLNRGVRIRLRWIQKPEYGYVVWDVVAVKP